MNIASQVIQSNEEVKCTIVTDRISHVLLFSVVQVFLHRPHFYSSVQRRSSATLWFKSRQCARVN